MKPTSFLALSIGCALVLAACGDKKSEASQRERTVAPSQSVHMSVETPEAKRVELPPVAEEVPAAGDELDDAARYPMRGAEVRARFEYVSAGAPIYPLSLLTCEGAPLTGPS